MKINESEKSINLDEEKKNSRPQPSTSSVISAATVGAGGASLGVTLGTVLSLGVALPIILGIAGAVIGAVLDKGSTQINVSKK